VRERPVRYRYQIPQIRWSISALFFYSVLFVLHIGISVIIFFFACSPVLRQKNDKDVRTTMSVCFRSGQTQRQLPMFGCALQKVRISLFACLHATYGE